MVAEAAFAIAARGKGVLIVIPRRDSIFEQVTAGTVIDARLSAPVIEAIFTSNSPLHDGAVVVSNDRVLRAGVVLPLATENDDRTHGTRHRAARGLAHVTDAFVICVSEERGSVCLARGEILEPMASVEQLRAALHRWGGGGDLGQSEGPPARAFRPKAALPHVAIFVSVVVAWAALALDRTHVITRLLPLEIRGVSDSLTFDPPRYTNVAVEIRSSRRELELLSPEVVAAYIDLSGTTVGSHLFLVRTAVPAGIEVASVTPNTIPMEIRSRAPPVSPAAPRRASHLSSF